MAEKEPKTAIETTFNLSFPPSRVKKIVKIDKDISRVTSEALHLISGAAELFLQFLAEKSGDVAAEKKRRTIKIDHLRLAVKRHQPTREFLFDSLPLPPPESQPVERTHTDRTVKVKPAPPHSRRIDSFFKKPVSVGGSNRVRVEDDVILDRVEDVEDVIPDRAEGYVVLDPVEDANDVIPVCVEDDVVLGRVEDEDDVTLNHVEDVDGVVTDRVEDEAIPVDED